MLHESCGNVISVRQCVEILFYSIFINWCWCQRVCLFRWGKQLPWEWLTYRHLGKCSTSVTEWANKGWNILKNCT